MSSLWIGIATVAVGAAGVASGASQNKKNREANDRNQKLFLEAQAGSEAAARELYDGLIANYNKSKERAEGLSIREYIGNQVTALNDPQLKEAFYTSREDDWNMAQKWAEEGSAANVSTFNKLVDVVGGGSYTTMLGQRNAAIFGDNVNEAFNRARELRNTNIPAGSVRKGPDGEALPNSRADKFEFGIAYEEVLKSNERMFDRTSRALNDDRTAAERQQERAPTFLSFLDYGTFTTNSVTAPFNQAKLNLSLNALNNDAALAQAALGKAVQNPLAPQSLDPNAGNAMIAQGTQLAIGALGQYASNNRGSGGYSTSSGANQGMSAAQSSYNTSSSGSMFA